MRDNGLQRPSALTPGKEAAYAVGVAERRVETGGARGRTATPRRTCFVCGRQREQDIALMHAFLCESCEGHIIVVDVSDGDYDFLCNE